VPESAEEWIGALGLVALPGESGWWAAVAVSDVVVVSGGREVAAFSSIYYLLDAERPVNVWHRLESDDTHVLIAGGPVEYVHFQGDRDVHEDVHRDVLGRDVRAGQLPMLTIPARSWKALRLLDETGFALIATVVTPAWTPDIVTIGLPPELADGLPARAAWLTSELVQRLNRP
jgi:uncharacterized protein